MDGVRVRVMHCCCCHVVDINMGEGGDEGEGDTLSPLDDNNIFVVVVVDVMSELSELPT